MNNTIIRARREHSQNAWSRFWKTFITDPFKETFWYLFQKRLNVFWTCVQENHVHIVIRYLLQCLLHCRRFRRNLKKMDRELETLGDGMKVTSFMQTIFWENKTKKEKKSLKLWWRKAGREANEMLWVTSTQIGALYFRFQEWLNFSGIPDSWHGSRIPYATCTTFRDCGIQITLHGWIQKDSVAPLN